LDLYNSAIILYSLDHDFNLAECFDWNLKEIVNSVSGKSLGFNPISISERVVNFLSVPGCPIVIKLNYS